MTNDDYYMNHVYMSEYWLWQYMLKHFNNHSNPRWIKQLNDEKKHSAMARGALRKCIPNDKIITDPSISIEKAMFEGIGKLDVDNIPLDDFPAFVYVVERRACMLFKAYVRKGTNEYYKKMTKRLLHDEADHLDIHKQSAQKLDVYEQYYELDKKIWNGISEVYSDGKTAFFDNTQYWKDLFANKLKDNVNVLH